MKTHITDYSAKASHKIAVKRRNEINASKQVVSEALKEIEKSRNSGEFECKYFHDEEIREALIGMGERK